MNILSSDFFKVAFKGLCGVSILSVGQQNVELAANDVSFLSCVRYRKA